MDANANLTLTFPTSEWWFLIEFCAILVEFGFFLSFCCNLNM